MPTRIYTDIALGTIGSTLANTPVTSRPSPTPGDLQAKVDLMLQDIAKANAERMADRKKMEAQQQFKELAAKYDEVICRMNLALLIVTNHTIYKMEEDKLSIWIPP